MYSLMISSLEPDNFLSEFFLLISHYNFGLSTMKQQKQKSKAKTAIPARRADRKKDIKKNAKLKARTPAEFNQSMKTSTSDIKNKQKRLEIRHLRKHTLKMLKAKARKSRKNLPAEQRQKPITIQDKQYATDGHLLPLNDNLNFQQLDEFNNVLTNSEQVKIMMTTSQKPTKRLYDFMRELMVLFQNIYYYPRQDFKLDQVYGFAKNMNYSHVIVVRDAGWWELLVRKIDGGLAVFKITNITLAKDIFHHGVATDHKPELILNNFNSVMGMRVGRLLASMFPQDPQFKGRRVVTFHNQRDFIFVRHHRYIFKDEFTRVSMQQIGPKFTLRLKKLYAAGEDNNVGGLEWESRDDMYVERSKIFL